MSAPRPGLLDAALDRTVIASYSNIGYRLRRRGWPADELARMDGKVVLVTGATSGLGEAAAAGYARLGACVHLVGRSRERCEQARERIAALTGSQRLRVGVCDLARLRSVRRFAARMTAESPSLHVLVNNAGVLTARRELSPDGIELTLATNVVGPFLLTELLLPLLRASAPARVVNVSSGGMYARALDVQDLQAEHGRFRGAAAYAHAKRMQVTLTELWAERLAGSGVAVHAMHPGWVDTPGLRDGLPAFRRMVGPLLRSTEQGADTIVWLGAAKAPGETSGLFWLDRAVRPTHMLPGAHESPAQRERLWSEIERLAGRAPSARPHIRQQS